MKLKLSIIRGPAGTEAECREIVDSTLSIGRGPGTDWTLTDPQRVLSKRHCNIEARDNAPSVTDHSSNGTYLNGVCLDRNQPRVLHDHDRLTIGSYEIEARLESDRDWDDVASSAVQAPETFGLDPLRPDCGDRWRTRLPGLGLGDDPQLLAEDNEIAADPFVVPDQVSSLEESFRPPRPRSELLPADWNVEDASPPQALAPPDAVQPPTLTTTPTPTSAEVLPAAGATDARLVAFAAGAGMAQPPSGDAETALRALGAAFRAVVSGLRRMMIARATVKGEFRIQQTMIRAAGNNPLKFSADDDDALAGLLGVGRRIGMSPEQAIAEAFSDMRRHELAVASAMQQAVREMLDRLEPNRVMFGGAGTAVDRAFGLQKRAAWDNYRRLHAETMRALADDFDNIFGRSFGRAYEAALASLAESEPERTQ